MWSYNLANDRTNSTLSNIEFQFRFHCQKSLKNVDFVTGSMKYQYNSHVNLAKSYAYFRNSRILM